MKKYVPKVVAFFALLAMLLVPASRAQVLCSYTIPNSEPANVVYDSSTPRLFASLFSANQVYVLGHGCVLQKVLSTGSGNPNGLAYDGTNLWVSLYSSDVVEKINVSTGNGTVYSVGSHPAGVAFDGTYVWVANSGSNTVTKLLASNGFVEDTITVGSYPYGVAVNGINGQNNVWIANRNSNTITVINTANNAIVTTIPTKGEPQFFQTVDTGGIYGGDMFISCYTGQAVEEFSPSGSLIASYSINGQPLGVAAGLVPAVYGATHNGELFTINTSSGLVSYTSVGSNNFGVAFDLNANPNTVWMTDLNQGKIYEIEE
jgi:YVTN family beta-propeller protein